MNLFPFIPGYTHNIFDSGREPALVMLVAFVLTFICARTYTRMARIKGWGSASIGDVHAHHLVFGVVIALIAGALAFALPPGQQPWVELVLAALFGGGAALILDEFALIFHLQDVYWEEQGRKSVDAVVIALTLGFLFMLRTAPLGQSDDSSRLVLTTTLIINLGFVVVAALKGKIYMAVIGVFVPSVAQVGAVRLGKPDSIWARRFYHKNSKKLQVATSRQHRYQSLWQPRKEWLWDVIGGKTGRPAK